MNFEELKWHKKLFGRLPREYDYQYSKICDRIFGDSDKIPIGFEDLDEYIEEIFDPDLWETSEELYALIQAAYYYKEVRA